MEPDSPPGRIHVSSHRSTAPSRYLYSSFPRSKSIVRSPFAPAPLIDSLNNSLPSPTDTHSEVHRVWKYARVSPQTGGGSEWVSVELGRLLFNESIKGAGANGLRTMDLLRGNEEYKYRLGAVDRWDETWSRP